MLSVYGLAGMNLAGLFTDAVKGGILFSPGRMAALCAENHVILGDSVERFTGVLRGSGVGH